MNEWLSWHGRAFLLVALILGLVGYHFSLRMLRIVAASYRGEHRGIHHLVWLNWHRAGRRQPYRRIRPLAPTRSARRFSTRVPGPTGWIVIGALLVIGYRELEAWALHCQAPQPGYLGADRPTEAGRCAEATTTRRTSSGHDLLAAELRFRLSAVQVRSPAILPGGSRSSGLASIAEASGVTGGGLAGAVINFFGMLWPGPRRVRVRVWVECNPGPSGVSTTPRGSRSTSRTRGPG